MEVGVSNTKILREFRISVCVTKNLREFVHGPILEAAAGLHPNFGCILGEKSIKMADYLAALKLLPQFLRRGRNC